MRERDIRPARLLEQYLALTATDALEWFDVQAGSWEECVGCGGHESSPAFEKAGFSYASCDRCSTLFLNPRPPSRQFDAFYRDSQSSRYWAEVFFPAVAEARREKVFRPRVERLGEILRPAETGIGCVVDAGAGYGIFLEEWGRRWPGARLVAVEPSPLLADVCRSKGFEVIETVVENLVGQNETADLVTCFEVLEHVYHPLEFLKALVGLLRPGARLVVSTLTIDGFDLRLLQDQSAQITPPHHINFLSKDGLRRLFSRAGLSDIEISTPGRLDVDIVRNAVEKMPEGSFAQRVIEALAPDDESAEDLQEHLVRHGLSSHAWVVARRPMDTR